jgi:phosphatidylserine decarboxylase
MKLHREGNQIIMGALVIFTTIWAVPMMVTNQAAWVSYTILPVCIIFMFLVLQFFRVPKRKNQSGPNELVCPCDGKVVVIEDVYEPEFFNEKRKQVSIFMSPLNVHVNWTPCEGKVRYYRYHAGLYLVAWHPKSSTENERTTTVIEAPNGKSVLVRQIAGAVARRIVCYAEEGKSFNRNDEMGFIKFGSRMDIFLPVDAEVKVKIGDKTEGNQTILASW